VTKTMKYVIYTLMSFNNDVINMYRRSQITSNIHSKVTTCWYHGQGIVIDVQANITYRFTKV